MNQKLLVNIGGTSRSGSTLLARILANDNRGMFLGEIHAIFNPTRKHHHIEINKIKNIVPWQSVLKLGRSALPASIFKNFQNIDFLVDSSKNSFWIQQSNMLAKRQNIYFKNVLIYKDPDDFAYSILKRGQSNWVKQYINYYKKFVSTVNSYYIVSYTSLMKNPKTLSNLCNWLGIDYTEDKLKYWEDDVQGFFGSSTPKAQRAIKYEKKIPQEFHNEIYTIIESNQELQKVWEFLRENENKVVSNVADIAHSKFKSGFLKLRNKIKLMYRRLNPENYFKN